MADGDIPAELVALKRELDELMAPIARAERGAAIAKERAAEAREELERAKRRSR